MRRWHLALYLPLLLGARGCTLDLEGASCDCAEGYFCCEVDKICYRPGHACGSGGNVAAGAGGQTRGTGGIASGGKLPSAFGGASVSGGEPSSSGGAIGGDGGDSAVNAGAASGGTSESTGGAPSGGLGGAPDASGGTAQGAFAVLTQHNDNQRTGVNPLERVLTQASVGMSGSFGELARRALRGAVFAQPLFVPDLPLASGVKNVVYVATMANVVYAFDAQDAAGPPLWVRLLDAPIQLPDPQIPLGADEIWHEIGILSSPTINGGTLFTVAASKTGNSYSHRLYALDLITGQVEKSVVIAAPDFDSAGHAQRAGLTHTNGSLTVAFGGYSVGSEASGWLFTYDTNLDLLGSLTLGNPTGAGVTMSGQAPAADAEGMVYFTTGPGAVSREQGSADWGRSLLKVFAPKANGIAALYGQSAAMIQSGEFGNNAPLLIPGSNLALVSGASQFYVVNRDASGANTPPVQTFTVNRNGSCNLSGACDSAPFPPVLWAGASNSSRQRLYTWLPNDLLRGFYFDANSGKFECPDADSVCAPFAQSALNDSRNFLAHPPPRGAALSFSTNLDTPGSALVWATHGYEFDGQSSDDGILRAYNGETLSALWDSNSGQAPLGPIAPGATPTISDGRVYVGTADGLTGRHAFTGNGNGGAPNLANFNDQFLIVAWGLSPMVTRGFELALSTDGVRFGETTLVPALFLNYEPALAVDDASRLYLGWCDATETAQVVVANEPRFTSYQSMLQRAANGALGPLALKATSPLALAFGNHRLFMAFYDEAGLHFISSSDEIAFELSSLRDFPEYFAYSAPLLSYQGDRLFLASTTTDGVVHLLVSNDDGVHFGPESALPMSSNGHPALMWDALTGNDAMSYSWIWTEKAGKADGALRISTGPVDSFSIFTGTRPLAAINANPSVAATRFKGSWYVAWSDTAGGLPNVARYSSGELVSYGLRAP